MPFFAVMNADADGVMVWDIMVLLRFRGEEAGNELAPDYESDEASLWFLLGSVRFKEEDTGLKRRLSETWPHMVWRVRSKTILYGDRSGHASC